MSFDWISVTFYWVSNNNGVSSIQLRIYEFLTDDPTNSQNGKVLSNTVIPSTCTSLNFSVQILSSSSSFSCLKSKPSSYSTTPINNGKCVVWNLEARNLRSSKDDVPHTYQHLRSEAWTAHHCSLRIFIHRSYLSQSDSWTGIATLLHHTATWSWSMIRLGIVDGPCDVCTATCILSTFDFSNTP